MPKVRGLLASLGASVSLVAAGALALLAISAVVALEGWPGLGSGTDAPALAVGQDNTTPGGERGRAEDEESLTLAATPRDEAPAPAVEPAGDDAPASRADDPLPLPRLPPPDDFVPGLGRDRDRDPGLVEDRPRVDDRVPLPDDDLLPLDTEQPVRGVTRLTGDVLRDVGTTAKPVTDTVLPGSGEVVEELTSSLGDTLESTGNTLGLTLGLLLAGGR